VRDVSEEYALLAVQGPNALSRLSLGDARPFTFGKADLDGIECMVARTGYTGEHGAEVFVAPEDAVELWDAILARGASPCGLGARDTLRLEMCYPLHGNDIGPDTDPISAGLEWVCALEKEFVGVEAVRRVAADGPERMLAAFVMEERAIPRQGMQIVEGGEVTSGTHSPMLEQGIGMGYVPRRLAEPGKLLTIDVRGRERRARVVEKPIYRREERRRGGNDG
jgi:aminomethyltransferase